MCTNKKHAENLLHARGKFSGRIGYVLAVAGSAVGLGNIWRFPYLAAKYGGGMFLLVYLILMVTFGYVMIVSETALGRMTKKSPVGAFHKFGKSLPFHLGGWINAVIPMMIVPYYSVIGGWVLKYLFEYIRGNANLVAQDGYFNSFITSSMEVEIWFLIFAALVFIVILAGVKNGVERVSKVMMPLLILLAACVAVYSITRPGAVEGIKYFLIPNLENFSWMTVVAAMGQMFYSLSIAMGILYTYGSYIGKDVEIRDLRMCFPGRVNVENATAAITVALYAGVTPEEIREALPLFKGVSRRFDVHAKSDRLIYIDDYAHHPREIEASLSSIREMWPDKRLTVAFQPHLYSRTNDFYLEFAKSLNLADQVILLDIYPAREQPIPGVTSGLIAERLTVPFVRVTKEEFPEYVKENVKEGVFMTVGAGDIDRFIPIFTEMFGGTDC